MSIEKKTIRSDIPGHHTMMMNTSSSYAPAGQEDSSRLVVGRNITLNGNIGACEHLVIEGTVEAQNFTARRVDILEAGAFSGSAEVQDAVIAGKFDGKIKITGRLTVKASGRITGEIDYGMLEVEAGARIEGAMRPITAVAIADVTNADVGVKVNDNLEALLETGEKGGKDETSTEGGAPRVFRRAVGF
ncbi:MAG: polymer-forming cytoskeletal protein [Micavibrio sp.]|nr:polymer-forming cytoskeletal protein [Micavibrio sp.]